MSIKNEKVSSNTKFVPSLYVSKFVLNGFKFGFSYKLSIDKNQILIRTGAREKIICVIRAFWNRKDKYFIH